MGLVNNGTGTKWTWYATGLGHSGTGKQRGWDKMDLVHNGAETKWTWNTTGLGLTEIRTKWDWDTAGLKQRLVWYTTGLEHSGPGAQ